MADNIIRQSQLITTYGPGAMIDLPNYSIIVSGLQDWSHLRREKVDEPRLAAKLRRLLDLPSLELWTPPRHEENARQAAPVGARIFPTWFIVKDARPSSRDPQWRRRRLVRWNHLDRGRFRDEDGKRKPVVPVRFVCGCRRGHIDDLDWRRFVHQSGRTCERPLWLEERGTGADIGDTFGVCDCGEERSLYEASSPGTGALGHCEGKRPWIGQFAREACGEPYRLLVRTASNAYFPQTMSVISLPEFDAGLAAKVSAHYDRLKAADDLGALENFRMIPELDAAFADTADETVLAEYRRQQGEGEREDVPVKTAEFEILDKGDDFIGEDDPRSRFFAATLERPAWDPDENILLTWLSTSWCWCTGYARSSRYSGLPVSRRSARTRTASSIWTLSGPRSPKPSPGCPRSRTVAKASSCRFDPKMWRDGSRGPACRIADASFCRGGAHGPLSAIAPQTGSLDWPMSCSTLFRTC